MKLQDEWKGVDFKRIDPKGEWRNGLLVAALELVYRESELPPEKRKLKYIHGLRNSDLADDPYQSAVNDFLDAACCLCIPVPELR